MPYADLDGFPHGCVSGHNPVLAVGRLEGQRVAVLGGRAHYYETGRADAMRPALEVLKALGCPRLILTNAAGSLRPDLPPGSLMLLSDHIAFAGTNPLIGEPSEARFVPMTDAHDPGLRHALMAAAGARGETEIVNAAREPEIVDLAAFLNGLGARVEGAGTYKITVQGTDSWSDVSHAIVPDRIEAASYLIAAAMTGGELEIIGARLEHLGAACQILEQAAARAQAARGLCDCVFHARRYFGIGRALHDAVAFEFT